MHSVYMHGLQWQKNTMDPTPISQEAEFRLYGHKKRFDFLTYSKSTPEFKEFTSNCLDMVPHFSPR